MSVSDACRVSDSGFNTPSRLIAQLSFEKSGRKRHQIRPRSASAPPRTFQESRKSRLRSQTNTCTLVDSPKTLTPRARNPQTQRLKSTHFSSPTSSSISRSTNKKQNLERNVRPHSKKMPNGAKLRSTTTRTLQSAKSEKQISQASPPKSIQSSNCSKDSNSERIENREYFGCEPNTLIESNSSPKISHAHTNFDFSNVIKLDNHEHPSSANAIFINTSEKIKTNEIDAENSVSLHCPRKTSSLIAESSRKDSDNEASESLMVPDQLDNLIAQIVNGQDVDLPTCKSARSIKIEDKAQTLSNTLHPRSLGSPQQSLSSSSPDLDIQSSNFATTRSQNVDKKNGSPLRVSFNSLKHQNSSNNMVVSPISPDFRTMSSIAASSILSSKPRTPQPKLDFYSNCIQYPIKVHLSDIFSLFSTILHRLVPNFVDFYYL